MIVINNIDAQRFSFNGIQYFKNFTPIVIGNKVRILNAYDSSIELTDAPRLFSDFEVNGITYLNVADLQSQLLPILYTRSTLSGGGGGAVDSVNGQTGVVVLDSKDIGQTYRTIIANTTLDDTYHNATIYVSATCNITIPSGLRSDFNCVFRTFIGVTATFITSGATINSQSDIDVLTESSVCYMANYAVNDYIISGGSIVQSYFTINNNTTLNNLYHGATVWVTANAFIIIPSGLRSDFYCNIRTFTGATATYLTSGTLINTESDGNVQAEKTMINISTFSINNFILSGGGLS